MSDLKPCPFCGGLPKISKHYKEEMYTLLHRCQIAGIISFDWGNKERHEKAWNTRFVDKPQPAPVEG